MRPVGSGRPALDGPIPFAALKVVFASTVGTGSSDETGIGVRTSTRGSGCVNASPGGTGLGGMPVGTALSALALGRTGSGRS